MDNRVELRRFDPHPRHSFISACAKRAVKLNGSKLTLLFQCKRNQATRCCYFSYRDNVQQKHRVIVKIIPKIDIILATITCRWYLYLGFIPMDFFIQLQEVMITYVNTMTSDMYVHDIQGLILWRVWAKSSEI